MKSEENYDDFIGKQVSICYELPEELYGRDCIMKTYGRVVNFTFSKVFIINRLGCLEIFRCKDIIQMREVKQIRYFNVKNI